MDTFERPKSLTQRLREMKIGDSFTATFSQKATPYIAAKNAGISITAVLTQDQPKKGHSVVLTRVHGGRKPPRGWFHRKEKVELMVTPKEDK